MILSLRNLLRLGRMDRADARHEAQWAATYVPAPGHPVDEDEWGLYADDPGLSPGLQPAPPITLPTSRPRACPNCTDPLDAGMAHYCRRRRAS